jgi:hypothetical protein
MESCPIDIKHIERLIKKMRSENKSFGKETEEN